MSKTVKDKTSGQLHKKKNQKKKKIDFLEM